MKINEMEKNFAGNKQTDREFKNRGHPLFRWIVGEAQYITVQSQYSRTKLYCTTPYREIGTVQYNTIPLRKLK